MQLPIDDIRVGDRHRRHLGDLENPDFPFWD